MYNNDMTNTEIFKSLFKFVPVATLYLAEYVQLQLCCCYTQQNYATLHQGWQSPLILKHNNDDHAISASRHQIIALHEI